MRAIPTALTACLLLLLPSCGEDSPPPPAVPQATIQEIRGHLAQYDLSAAKTVFNKLEHEWTSREEASRSALDPIWNEIVAVETEIRDKRRAGYERFEGSFVHKSEIGRILKERAEEEERQRLAAREREEQRLREEEQRERERQAEAARREEERQAEVARREEEAARRERKRKAEDARREREKRAEAARKKREEKQAEDWKESLNDVHEGYVALGLVTKVNKTERLVDLFQSK